MNIDWIDTLIGLAAGGGLVGIFTIPSAIKKAKAEAKEPEIEAWRKLVDELQEQNRDLRERITTNENRIDELNRRIDDLYKTNGEWREENNNLKLQLDNELATVNIDKIAKNGYLPVFIPMQRSADLGISLRILTRDSSVSKDIHPLVEVLPLRFPSLYVLKQT